MPWKWLLAIFGEFSNGVGWQMNYRTVEIPNSGPASVENLIFRWFFGNRENPIILSKNANFSMFYPISAKDLVEKPTKTPRKLFLSRCRPENLDILRSPPCGNLPHICANWPNWFHYEGFFISSDSTPSRGFVDLNPETVSVQENDIFQKRL